jgi:hypothetical protein
MTGFRLQQPQGKRTSLGVLHKFPRKADEARNIIAAARSGRRLDLEDVLASLPVLFDKIKHGRDTTRVGQRAEVQIAPPIIILW